MSRVRRRPTLLYPVERYRFSNAFCTSKRRVRSVRVVVSLFSFFNERHGNFSTGLYGSDKKWKQKKTENNRVTSERRGRTTGSRKERNKRKRGVKKINKYYAGRQFGNITKHPAAASTTGGHLDKWARADRSPRYTRDVSHCTAHEV